MGKLYIENFFRGPLKSASWTQKGPRTPLWEPLFYPIAKTICSLSSSLSERFRVYHFQFIWFNDFLYIKAKKRKVLTSKSPFFSSTSRFLIYRVRVCRSVHKPTYGKLISI